MLRRKKQNKQSPQIIFSKRDFAKIEKYIINTRRALHKIPEQGLQEKKTCAFIKEELNKLGITNKKVAGTGIVATIKGKKKKCIAFRADMDAVPVQETAKKSHIPNKKNFASTHASYMHSCGHDAHMAILLGLAKLLSQHKDILEKTGSVKLIFQPGEEGYFGAKQMIEKKALLSPEVNEIYALHGSPDILMGKIGLRSGPIFAAVDTVAIEIKGEGGHGAYPHQTADPIISAAHIITALQTIVSRKVDPLKNAVISICQVQGGTASNVIPETVKIVGTVRTLDKKLRLEIEKTIKNMVNQISRAFNVISKIDYQKGYPVTINSIKETEFIKKMAEKYFGKDSVIQIDPQMGAEDFSYFLEKIPGVMVLLGTGNSKKKNSLHSNEYFFPERLLIKGVELFARII